MTDSPNYNRILNTLLEKTTCPWTKGYLESFLTLIDPLSDLKAIFDQYNSEFKIKAIKEIRNLYGVSLKQAKECADLWYNTGQLVDPRDLLG